MDKNMLFGNEPLEVKALK
jgi:hypothetical protein